MSAKSWLVTGGCGHNQRELGTSEMPNQSELGTTSLSNKRLPPGALVALEFHIHMMTKAG